MPTGVVKFYLEEKGYGFIVPDDESIDVFVHHSGISPGAKGTSLPPTPPRHRKPAARARADTTLVQDERVTYEMQAGDDGKQKAVNISLLPRDSRGPPHDRPPQRDLRESLRERDMPPRGGELRDRDPPRDREFGYPPPPGRRDFDERGPPSGGGGFREGDFDRRDSRDFDRRDDNDRRERDFRYPPDNGNRSPPREDRGPPRRDLGDRGPPGRGDGPSRDGPPRDGPPRDDRAPPPRRDFGDRGPPHDDRPPPRRDFGNRSPPRGGPGHGNRSPPRGDRGPPPGPPRDRLPLPPPPPPHARRLGEGEPRPPPTWSSRVEEAGAGARPEPRQAANGRLPPGAGAAESGRTSRSGSMLGDGDEGALEGVVAEHTEAGGSGGGGGGGGSGSGGLSSPLGAALEGAAGAGGPSDAASTTEAEGDTPARKRARAEPAAAHLLNGGGGGGAARPRKVRVWLPLQERSVELPAETTLGELLQWGWCIVAPPNGGLPAASGASTTEEVEA